MFDTHRRTKSHSSTHTVLPLSISFNWIIANPAGNECNERCWVRCTRTAHPAHMVDPCHTVYLGYFYSNIPPSSASSNQIFENPASNRRERAVSVWMLQSCPPCAHSRPPPCNLLPTAFTSAYYFLTRFTTCFLQIQAQTSGYGLDVPGPPAPRGRSIPCPNC
jgi:hypothetical protein